MNDLFRNVHWVSLWLGRVWVLLLGPWLLQSIPVNFRCARQCQLEEFCGCLQGHTQNCLLLFQYAAKIVKKCGSYQVKVLKSIKKAYLFCFVFYLH